MQQNSNGDTIGVNVEFLMRRDFNGQGLTGSAYLLNGKIKQSLNWDEDSDQDDQKDMVGVE